MKNSGKKSGILEKGQKIQNSGIVILVGIAITRPFANEEVRKRTGQILLEKVIRERRMRWLGHVTRMDEVSTY